MAYQGKREQYLRSGPRNWPIFPSSTSSPQTTDFPTRHLALRRAPSASNSSTEPIPAAIVSFSCWADSPRWTLAPVGLQLPSRGFIQASWMCWCDPSSGCGAPGRPEACGIGMTTAADGCYKPRRRRLRLCTGPRRIDSTMTPARPDHSMDPESSDSPDDDMALMTDRSRTLRSELSCFVDVASSICEKTYPDSRVLGLGRTYRHSPRGSAKTWRCENGVSSNCTKCIQLGFLCLIIISHGIVVPITASISCLHLHPLFYSLFYRGDLKYCLYVKYSFFYNLYKVITKCWMCPIMFLLLDKNGSILE